MSVLLRWSLHRTRRAASLVGAFMFLALGATSALAAGTSTTGTNPASSALGPVSTNAAKGTGGGTAAGGTPAGSGTAAGGTPAGAGTPDGAAPTTSVPTTTYAPPATGRIGAASPEIQRAGTPAAT